MLTACAPYIIFFNEELCEYFTDSSLWGCISDSARYFHVEMALCAQVLGLLYEHSTRHLDVD